MKYEAIVVGGGIAGLTAAAYLAKEGYRIALFEKEDKTGGLVNSFKYKDFVFDGGIRAVEDLGILIPMLNQLGIELDFLENPVSLGVEDKMINLKDVNSIYEYQKMLNDLFPESRDSIQKIIDSIEKIMVYMDIQYGIENPVFKDIKNDRQYLFNILLPWLFKYVTTISKVKKLYEPVDEYLEKLTDNKVLIDMIAQHFFEKTPTYFALSYFTLYLNYRYPTGGTGKLTEAIEQYVLNHGAEIKYSSKIVGVDPGKKTIRDENNEEYSYKYLIWAADMKRLYDIADVSSISARKTIEKIQSKKELMSDKTGGDSVFTVYATCGLPADYFSAKHGAHVFYTPFKKGLNNIAINRICNGDAFSENKKEIFAWLKDYFKYTTYEISIPAMRDSSLAPEGKTGLIISSLMNYHLVSHIEKMGWYEKFKTFAEREILTVLSDTIYLELSAKLEDAFSSSPITIERNTGNLHGAITGWAFTNDVIPAVSSLTAIAKSALTEIPDVYQAGQWTFSPSGMPISIITGKMAADRVAKKLSKTN